MKKTTIKPTAAIIVMNAIIFFSGGTSIQAKNLPLAPAITIENNRITIQAESVSISVLVKEISNQCGIKITGLEHRNKEKISFSVEKVTIENALQQIFKKMDETSYAFEYKGNKLFQVKVVPELKKDIFIVKEPEEATASLNEESEKQMRIRQLKEIGASEGVTEYTIPPSHRHFLNNSSLEKHQEDTDDPPETVVKILRVIENTQGFEAGLLTGDIIIEYNGVTIDNARTLIREVNKTSSEDEINITVLRDDENVDFNLNGGKIGVSVQTVNLDESKNPAQ